MARWLKVALIVAAGFAFTARCTLLGTSSTLVDGMRTDPNAYSVILLHIFLVMRPGMVISARLQPDLLGHSSCLSLGLASNALLCSGVFGLALWLLRPVLRKSKQATISCCDQAWLLKKSLQGQKLLKSGDQKCIPR